MTVNSLLQNTFVYAICYTLSHHWFLFAIFGYCLTRGVPSLLYVAVPTVIANSIVSLGYAFYYIFDQRGSMTRYPMICSMSASQIVCLAAVYGLGYFCPMLYCFEAYGRHQMSQRTLTHLVELVCQSLALDLIFTVLLSTIMLRRKSLRDMQGSLYLPIGLCILSLIVAQNFDLIRTDQAMSSNIELKVDEFAKERQENKEHYMWIMSRFCLSFVNVASKVFLLKQAAY